MSDSDPQRAPLAPSAGTAADPLSEAWVDEAVRALRPDYRALLVVVSGRRGGPTDEDSDAALRRAEDLARRAGGEEPFDTVADGEPVTVTADPRGDRPARRRRGDLPPLELAAVHAEVSSRLLG